MGHGFEDAQQTRSSSDQRCALSDIFAGDFDCIQTTEASNLVLGDSYRCGNGNGNAENCIGLCQVRCELETCVIQATIRSEFGDLSMLKKLSLEHDEWMAKKNDREDSEATEATGLRKKGPQERWCGTYCT